MNSLLAALFVSAFLFIQCYISGTRLAFSLPAYALIGLAAVAAAFVRAGAPRPSRACVVASVVLFSYVLARAWLSPVEYLARADLYMVLACLAVYVLTLRHFAQTHIRLLVLGAMFALAIAEALIGLWQFTKADDWMPFGLVRKPSETRASGTFISSIHFAGYLEAIGPFALALAVWGARAAGARVLCGCVALLCYFGVVISGSRGGWLSALFSLAVFVALSWRILKRTNPRAVPAFLYAGILCVVLVATGIVALMGRSEMLRKRMDLVSRITAVVSGDEKAAPYDIRVYNWQAALDQWRLSPITGTGAGTHLYYGRLYRRPALQTDPEHVHSDYLELLAEYGLLAAVAMAAFLLAHGAAGLRGFHARLDARADDPYVPSHALAIHLGALTAFAAYLAHSAVDFNLHLPGNALLFAFIFGILASPQPAPVGDDTPPPRSLGARILLLALGTSLLAIAILRLPGEYWCEKARVTGRDARFAEAIAHAHRALRHEARNPYIYYHLGQAHRLRAATLLPHQRTEDLRAAAAAYRAGIALFPQDEDLWLRLGQTLDALGEYRDARDAYQTAIAHDPNLGLAHAYFARHLQRVGREAEAEAALQRARSLIADPKAAEFIQQHLDDL